MSILIWYVIRFILSSKIYEPICDIDLILDKHVRFSHVQLEIQRKKKIQKHAYYSKQWSILLTGKAIRLRESVCTKIFSFYIFDWTVDDSIRSNLWMDVERLPPIANGCHHHKSLMLPNLNQLRKEKKTEGEINKDWRTGVQRKKEKEFI